MTPSDLELIEAYTQGRLSEDELVRVFELLENDASARAYLRTLSAVESWLGDHAIAASEMRESLIFQDSVHEADHHKDLSSTDKQPQVIRGHRFFLTRNFIAAAAAIAGIAIILSLLVFNNIGQQEQFVATVEYISDDAQIVTPVFSDSQNKASTAPIEMTSGVLKLRFNYGAAVTLHGPVRFIPTDEHGGTLVHGMLIGKAPANNSGLHIVGPNFNVTDLGTEFALKVDKTHGSELFVIEGSVALKPQNGQQIIAKQDDGFHIDANNQFSVLNKAQITDAFSKILHARHDPYGILTPDTVAYLLFTGRTSDAWMDLAADTQIPATISADPQTGAAILNGTEGIKIKERMDLLIDSPMSFETRIFIERADYIEALFSVHSRIKESRTGWGVSINEGADGSYFPLFEHYNVKQYEFSQINLPVNRWIHVMFTVDDTKVQLFVDGVSQGEMQRVGRMRKDKECAAYIGIGGRGNRRDSKFTGKVSYIAVHKRLLTKQEINDRLKSVVQP